MKKLFLWICCLLLCWPLGSFAESINQTLFFEENNVLTSIATFQDDLYLLTYEGIFQYDMQSGIPALVTDEVTGDYRDESCADWLCATESGLYAIQCANRTVLQILDETGYVNIETLVQFESDEETFILAAAMTRRYLCLLEQGDAGILLNWLDLTTNAWYQQKVDGAFCITPYGDSIAYAAKTTKRGITEYSVTTIDLASGETTNLFAPSISVDSLCGMENGLYFVNKNRVYRWRQGDQEPAEMASIPSGDVVACTVFSTQIAVVVDNSLAIRSIDHTAQQTTLTIYQPSGRSSDYQEFLSTHPDIELNFVGSTNAEAQFVQDVLTQSETTDIYQLTDISILRSISEKRIGQNLSVSPIIVAAVQDMYSAFADVFSADGCIWAVPSVCYLAVLGYDKNFFEQFDLPIPTTVMELLELTEQWLLNYANDYPEAQFDPFSNGLTLDAILRQYEVEKEITGQALSFSDEYLASIISKYQEMERLYWQNPRSYQVEISAFNTLDLPHSAQYQPLILPIQREAQAVISNAYLEVEFYVVNPYSEHMDEAIAFLESTCTSWDAPTQALLLQSCDNPIESPTYQSDYAMLTEKINEVEEKLQISNAEKNDVLRAELEGFQQEMELLQINRWMVTEEEIAFYKKMTNYMVFKTDDPLDELDEQLLSSYQQLQKGRISATDFLRTLDDKVRMVLLEMGI